MYLKFIDQALKGAKYHEAQAFFFAHPKENKYDFVTYHLRAYFWELWSVWDYVLQLANSKTLNLEPEKVRRDFLKKLIVEQPKYVHLSKLKSIQENEQLIRIRKLRDHAHKWQVDPYLVEYNGDVVNVIALNNLDGKNKKLPKQINIDRNDLWFMKKAKSDLSMEGFFK